MKRLALTTLAGIMAMPVFAMPDPKVSITGLTSQVSMVGINNIMGDDLNPKLIYIMPSDIKVSGKFTQISAGISCTDLHNLRTGLLKYPSSQEETQRILSSGQYYSPLFEATIAFEARSSVLKQKITDLRLRANQLREDNRELYNEYQAAYGELESIKAEGASLEENLKSTHANYMSEMAMVLTEADRAAIRETYLPIFSDLRAKIAQNIQYRTEASTRFSQASRGWAPFRDELAYIREFENDLMGSMERYQKQAKDHLETSKNYIYTLGKKVVGKATAGYSLASNDQLSILRERIREAGLDYDVRQLDVFNVKMNPSVISLDSEVRSDHNRTYRLASYEVDDKNSISLGVEDQYLEMPAKLESEDGKTENLKFLVKKFNNNAGAAQDFEMPISIASYCGEPTYVDREITFSNTSGETVKTKVNYPVFELKSDRLIYAQNVSLAYNYYQKAEPIEGRCELDVSKSSNYVRDSGKKKTGGFWRRRTTSWDHTRHDYSNNMGLKCELDKRPVGSTPEESALINEAVEKALYQDIFHMFIMSYAKEYTITEVPHTELGEDSRFFSQVGAGVMNLCGKNKMCEFGGVVLKSIDDLVGSRHTGSSSHRQSMTGKIKKDLKLSSYLIGNGSAKVEMTVCLNNQTCK